MYQLRHHAALHENMLILIEIVSEIFFTHPSRLRNNNQTSFYHYIKILAFKDNGDGFPNSVKMVLGWHLGPETNILPNTNFLFLKGKNSKTVVPREALSGHKKLGLVLSPSNTQGNLIGHTKGYFVAEIIYKSHSE